MTEGRDSHNRQQIRKAALQRAMRQKGIASQPAVTGMRRRNACDTLVQTNSDAATSVRPRKKQAVRLRGAVTFGVKEDLGAAAR
jgi:hypothetical protein